MDEHIAAIIIQNAWINHKYPGQRYCPECDTYNTIYHMQRMECGCGCVWRPINAPFEEECDENDGLPNFSDEVETNSLNFPNLEKYVLDRINHLKHCKNCFRNWETEIDDYILLGVTVGNFTSNQDNDNNITVELNRVAYGKPPRSCVLARELDLHVIPDEDSSDSDSDFE